MENELIVVEKIDPIVVFTGDGMPKILKEIEEKALAYCSTLSEETAAGRKEIASLAYKVAQSKTLIDDMGIVVADDSKKKIKLIDGNRKLARDFLDALKKKVRKPLTDWEEYEERRKAEAKRLLGVIAQARVDALSKVGASLAYDQALSMSQSDFEMFLKEMTDLHGENQLRVAAEKKAQEEEFARLAAERKKFDEERAEQDRKQKEQAAILKVEQDKIAAERKAIEDEKREINRLAELEKAKKEAAEKAIIEAAEKADREAKAKAEAEQKAKAEAERQEALKPDKEKLIEYAAAILAVSSPGVSSEAAKAVSVEAQRRLRAINSYIIKTAQEL